MNLLSLLGLAGIVLGVYAGIWEYGHHGIGHAKFWGYLVELFILATLLVINKKVTRWFLE